MASQIEIINLALTKLGQRHISSLAENNEAARFYQANYENLLLSELRSHVWGFAKARIALPALGTTPAFVYTYEYALPEGYVRALQVGDFQPGVSLTDYRDNEEGYYSIEQGKILTNFAAPLNLRYIKRVSEGLFDPLFVTAFACKLAHDGCYRITNSNSLKENLGFEYKEAVDLARNVGAVEIPSQKIPDDEWLLARL
jgi:hypothetical protein